MSFVITEPELVQGAAQDLAGIRSSLAEATTTVAGPTTGIAAAAQDEVSVAIASMFGNYGQEFQALSAQAQAFHAQFVTAMNAGAAAYVGAEAANAGQTLLGGGVLGNIGQNVEVPQFTEALYDARELAMSRMQAEAEALQAEGIVGVQLLSLPHRWGGHTTEFFAIGTAVRPLRADHTIAKPQLVLPLVDS